ncbi:MAG: sulfatase family protein [Planctomycetota bacterium]|jgi:arylsulfatase A-like enzyme
MENGQIARRDVLKATGIGTVSLLLGGTEAYFKPSAAHASSQLRRPNLLFIFADQWRAQATGYAGHPDVKTPHLDKLAAESVNFRTAVSGCPVCCPFRASLVTGQYPLTHGVFLNDALLNNKAVSIAQACNRDGYDTGYIGKWHLDGTRRTAFIPRERRQGFQFWKALGCTHNYNNSHYYADENVKLKWDGYDAFAQTREAQRYVRNHATAKPFALFLSWGPPHAPYHTAPEKYRAMYKPEDVTLRPNVPEADRAKARKALAGYYAHIAALDDCMGDLLRTLDEAGVADDTIVGFTSDHGDMLYSHGGRKKQQPWDESIRVPFLLRYPRALGTEGRAVDMPINTPDIMPTLLGLCGIDIPQTVEGADFSAVLTGQMDVPDHAALISCPSPFGQWNRKRGGREYRGLRTARYTYARDLKGPWLLYDNVKDPYQLNNLCGKPEHAALQEQLEKALTRKLEQTRDDFRSGWDYIEQWGYTVDASGTIPYTN